MEVERPYRQDYCLRRDMLGAEELKGASERYDRLGFKVYSRVRLEVHKFRQIEARFENIPQG